MIIKKSYLVVLIFLFIYLFPFNCYCQEEESYLEGINLYKAGKYEEAIDVFSKIVKKSLDKDLTFKAYIYLGYTYFTIGALDQASFNIEKGVELKQNVDLDEEEFVPDFINFYIDCKDRVVGVAFIESIPSSASIYLDNKKLGKTPIKREFLSQKYYLRLVKWGYDPVVKEIEIKIGEVNHYKVDLSKERNWVTFIRSSLVMIVVGMLLNLDDLAL